MYVKQYTIIEKYVPACISTQGISATNLLCQGAIVYCHEIDQLSVWYHISVSQDQIDICISVTFDSAMILGIYSTHSPFDSAMILGIYSTHNGQQSPFCFLYFLVSYWL